jgi:hypothetical protein
MTVSGVQYSVGATKYCGASPWVTTGAISFNGAVGYAGAKAACQACADCGNSPSAHMCTAQEIIQSAQLGLQNTLPQGWYSSGLGTFGNSNEEGDCNGWESGSDFGVVGPDWTSGFVANVGAVPAPGLSPCTAIRPILCCD